MNKIENSKKKYLLILSTLLLLLLIMGSASATNDDKIVNETISTTSQHDVGALSVDSVDEKVSTADNTIVGSKDTNENNIVLGSNNNQNTLKTETKNFTDLKNEITTSTNKQITLTSNYYQYITGDTVAIDVTNKIIDGDGATIDANNTANIYPFSSNGNTTIKNIKFINVLSNQKDGNFRGGPVRFMEGSSNIIFDNCNFTQLKTTSEYVACAIGIPGGKNVTIKNCNFYNNTAYNTLVIAYPSYCENITIENCIFKNNKQTNNNGVVYFNQGANVTIKNTKFSSE